MSRRFVRDLAEGESIDELFLVMEKQVRSNRQGQPYLLLELRDKSGQIGARLWNINEDQSRSCDSGHLVRVRGKVQSFQGAPQIILSHVEDAGSEGIDLTEYLPQAVRNPQEMLQRLRSILLSRSNPHLKALAECFLIDDELMTRYATAPAGVRVHHAYQGGLLEHVLTIMEVATRIEALYPNLDFDLLLLGIFLHDIGKIAELSYHRSFGYTDEGQLVGHLVQGVELLNAKVAQTAELTGEPFPDELCLRLKHMIVSHHGPPEFGSPKPPMTPEAVALHHLDNLDAKVNAFLQQIEGDRSPDSAWTAYDPTLGHRLFKGSTPDPID